MKYRTKRSLDSMWLEMFNHYYDMNKRAMGGELTPYGKEECRRQVNEFLNEVEDEKRCRLYDILHGHAVIRKPYWR